MTSWPSDTVPLLLRDRRRRATASELVAWAVRALSEGYDTQSVRVLAGLDLAGLPSPFETEERFHAALAELQIEVPDTTALLRLYVRDVAVSVIEGAVEPRAAVDRIHREAVSPFEHPVELMPWCDLWEGLDPNGRGPLGGRALDEAILRTARGWIGGAAEQADAADEAQGGTRTAS